MPKQHPSNDDEKAIIENHLFSDTSQYQDIMDLPHHVSKAHLPMSHHDRAGQFAPFSALTGFHQLIDKTAQHYQHKCYLDKTEQDHIENQLQHYHSGEAVAVHYFNADSGYYETIKTNWMKIDWLKRRANFTDLNDTTKHYSVPIANIESIRTIS